MRIHALVATIALGFAVAGTTAHQTLADEGELTRRQQHVLTATAGAATAMKAQQYGEKLGLPPRYFTYCEAQVDVLLPNDEHIKDREILMMVLESRSEITLAKYELCLANAKNALTQAEAE